MQKHLPGSAPVEPHVSGCFDLTNPLRHKQFVELAVKISKGGFAKPVKIRGKLGCFYYHYSTQRIVGIKYLFASTTLGVCCFKIFLQIRIYQ